MSLRGITHQFSAFGLWAKRGVFGIGGDGVAITPVYAPVHIKPTAAPSGTGVQAPAKGDLYFDSTANGLQQYNGTSWLPIQAQKVAPATTGTVTFTSIAASSTQDQTVTVTGAALGDLVVAQPTATIAAGLIWHAFVSATNTVTIRMANVTAGALTPAATTWRIVDLG